MMISQPLTLMPGVEAKTAWMTEDGKTFPSAAEANSHAAKLQLRKLLDIHSVGRGGEWDEQMFYDFLIEQAHSVAAMLHVIRHGTVE